jgi:STE24 endopeptidase
MSSTSILAIILIITIAHFLFDRWLAWLNLKRFSPELPKEAGGIYDEEKYAKAMEYQKVRSRFSLISSSISAAFTIALLSFGLFGDLDVYLRQWIENPFWQPFLFFGVLAVVSDIFGLPFQLYSTFVIEERFGFNKTTIKVFVADKLKGYLLGAILGGGLLFCFLYIIEKLGSDFWWIFLLVIMAFSLLMNLFYASWILPIFNKLKPLADGELRNEIAEFARKVDFPLTKIMVIDGSKRSSRANAFFSGMGRKKQIVLYDTLIEQHDTDELVAVLAHEVGHYKLKHIPKSMSLSFFTTGLMLFVLSLLLFEPKLSLALGGDQWAIHLNLLAFGILYSPISFLIGLLGNLLSRKNEFEADSFAAKYYAAAPLQNALKKLSVENLAHLTPHPLYVFFNYSHPPLLKRLANLEREKAIIEDDIT